MITASLIFASASPGQAQNTSGGQSPPQSGTSGVAAVPSLAAVHIENGETIHLDGVLDEPAWQRATSAEGFRQKDPVEGADPSERTEVRVILDNNDLYIGAILYDRDPDGIVAFQKRRDAFLFTDDRFMVILDTFLDGRTGYYFETNPAGVLGDGIIGGSSGGRGGVAVTGESTSRGTESGT
jgi:hypothetical protein